MSSEQISLLRYLKKNGSIATTDCSASEADALKWLLKMGYVQAVTDDTDYRNFTSVRRITQQGLAAYSEHCKSVCNTVLSVVAIAISAATLILSICGII